MQEKKQKNKFIRVGGPYTLEKIFKKVAEVNKGMRIKIGKHSLRVSNRILMFKENPSCVRCGLTGVRFYAEKMTCDKRPHLNLYAEKDGKEILMTKDHIIPKCFGGPDRYENLQTMCTKCNNKKSNEPERLRELIKIPEDEEVIKDLIINMLFCYNVLKKEKNPDGSKKYAELIKKLRKFFNSNIKIGRNIDEVLSL